MVRFLLALFFSISLWLSAQAGAATAQPQPENASIMVMADPSLAVPITQLARRYSQAHLITITTAFTPSHDQARLIEDGASADIFIAARARWVDDLRAKGLTDVYSQSVLVRNRLVLVGPGESRMEIALSPTCPLAASLRAQNDSPLLAVGNPDYLSEGGFAIEMLRKHDMMQDIEPLLAFFRDSGEIADTISKHAAYGITYATEAAHMQGTRVIGLFPEEMHTPVIYQAVIVAGENMTPARAFLEYLKSDEAKAVFKADGFLLSPG